MLNSGNNFYEADNDFIEYARKREKHYVEDVPDIVNIANIVEVLKESISQLKWKICREDTPVNALFINGNENLFMQFFQCHVSFGVVPNNFVIWITCHIV